MMAFESGNLLDWNEWRLLLTLRDTPDLFSRLKEKQGTEFQIQAQLRREFPDDLVRAALTLCELRRKGLSKFHQAEEMWFDRTGLEQCTAECVARHKALRFQGTVWDYCSGIGADASAIATRGCWVIAVDSNPANCLRSRWNAEILAPHDPVQVVCARVEQLTDRSGLIHVDPDRRAAKATRAVKIEDYLPNLDSMQRWTREFQGGAIKLSPAANFGGKFQDCEIELVSVHGECKEATIWFGSLRGKQDWRATCLPSGESIAGDPMEAVADITPLKSLLYDPDPAIVRSGLVDVLADRYGLTRLDPAEEYLTSEQVIDSPFVRGFHVDTSLPYDIKDLKAYFRKVPVGQLEIKCRHIPVDVERLRKQLHLQGSSSATLIIARIEGRARYVICRRVNS